MIEIRPAEVYSTAGSIHAMARYNAWIIFAFVIVGGWWVMSRPSGEPTSEIVDPAVDPAQTETDREPFRVGESRITPRASYDISAEIASVERYRFDGFASVSPVDAVLTWGGMPEPPYADRVSYDQMGRFYFWHTRASDLDLKYIESHSANVHLIPATDNLRRALVGLDAGDRVRLRGLLVDIDWDDGHWVRTSTVRTDTGPGACEVFWVEEAQVDDSVYR